LRRLPTIRLLGLCVIAALTLALIGATALLGSYVYLEPSLPTVDAMRSGSLAVPLRVYARDGELISEIGDKRRLPVAYQDIPPLVRDAFVSAEDERFFEHHGFDYSGVLRAAWVDLMSGDFSQGASTITMQAARNMFLNFDKTIRRKLQEIFLTYRMEHEFTKEQILGTYLNVIFLGQRSYGVAAAAQTYYGKPLAELTVAQAATLAGIPQAPSRYNPIFNPRAVKARRHYVLGQMLKLGYIDAATARQADAEPVQARDHGGLTQVEAPYVAEMARAALVARYGENAVNVGYKVYTTIDGRLQAAANRAVRLGLIEYDRRNGDGYRGPLGHLQLPAALSTARLDAALAALPAIGDLQPAVVTSVASRGARVYVQSLGFAQIDWDGLSWARRRLSDTRTGPAPQRASDVLQPGDLVYVIANGQGMAQLAQLPSAQGALVALDPDDGAIAALVGGFDYYNNKFNRATQAHRQPGSGFKPFLYSCALDHGFTPASIVLDAPITYDDNTQEQIWRPKNAEGVDDFEGPMRLREGLVFSRNLMTIRVVRDLGVANAATCTSRFGFDPKQMPQDLTLALGSLTVTPVQLASAYAVFANGGYRVDSYFIDRIENASGQIVYQAAPKVVCDYCDDGTVPATPAGPAAAGAAPASPTALAASATAAAAPGAGTGAGSATSFPLAAAASAAAAAATAMPIPATPAVAAASPIGLAGAPGLTTAPTDPNRAPAALAPPLLPPDRIAPRVISAQNCWLMDDMMADVIKRGTGARALVLGRSDIAGKTGTSNDDRDAWFNGFNRHIVASVWVGYDDTRPLGAGEEGSRAAVPIWIDFMREALRGEPDRPRPLPPGLVTVRISKRTGLLASPGDTDTMYETFMEGNLPPAPGPGLVAPGSNPANPAGTSPAPLF
jgi:penicillin-binding protein 1A